MSCEEEIGRIVETWTEEELREFADQFKEALLVELVCGGGLPADYRRALMRQELAVRDDTAAEALAERIMGRLDHDDPLILLMMGQA